jgi:hypothetical protein
VPVLDGYRAQKFNMMLKKSIKAQEYKAQEYKKAQGTIIQKAQGTRHKNTKGTRV